MKQLTQKVINYLSQKEFRLLNDYKSIRKTDNWHFPSLSNLFLKTKKTLINTQESSIPIKIYLPRKSSDKLIVFFHGGGWCHGNLKSHNKFCLKIAHKTKSNVVACDYRLAPENRFPRGLNDCYEVAKYFYLNKDLLNIENEHITLMGDSAGANLAASVSLMCQDKNEFMPTKQILIYPTTDSLHNNSSFKSMQEKGTQWYLTKKRICNYEKLYLSSSEDYHNPYYAPLLAKNIKKQPITLIITAEYDPLNDEGAAYCALLKNSQQEAQVYEIKNAVHGFINSPFFTKENKDLFTEINSFLNK